VILAYQTKLRALTLGGLMTAALTACAQDRTGMASTAGPAPSAISSALPTGEVRDFNRDWKFRLADDAAFAEPGHPDGDWRVLDVPHDWSIEAPFDEKFDGATGYLPGGIGWYRKSFPTPADPSDHTVVLNFDGIYNHSDVYLNGKRIGGEVNGYRPFNLDLTPHLKPVGQENVIAVRVDRTRYIDSRWYPGSGIYRDVRLHVLDKLHVPVWGTYITTPRIDDVSADVSAVTQVRNDHSAAQDFEVETQVISPGGKIVARQASRKTLPGNTTGEITHMLVVSQPERWDIQSPNLYTARTLIRKGGRTVASHEERFGIRTLEFNPEKGFFLNGRHVLFKGVNLHHDAGLVGAAVPDDVLIRRLNKLREAGVNAIRVSHNPSSRNLLDIADRMGFLVQAEIFDEWDNPKDKRLNKDDRHDDYVSRGYADWFQTLAEPDLKATVMRDRNHPSVIMWSIGNEIEWTYPGYAESTGYFDMQASGNYFFNPPRLTPEQIRERFRNFPVGKYVLADTAKKLSRWVKELDTTRPVTANMILPSVSHETGYTDALDVLGYSYRRVIYDWGHKYYPGKLILGSENVGQWHEWKAVLERPFVGGIFIWTGADYLGESHKAWPRKATRSGLLNTASLPNPSFHMFKALWREEPYIKLTTNTVEQSPYQLENGKLAQKGKRPWNERVWDWYDVNYHWNYQPGQTIAVEAYTNCPDVELFLDGRSMGVQRLADNPDHTLKWVVPYAKGELVARGLNGCRYTDTIRTAGEPARIEAMADRKSLMLDSEQVSQIEINLTDAAGTPVRQTERPITVALSDGLELVGTDSGHTETMTSYKLPTVQTYQGQALAIVRPKKKGPATVTFTGPGIETKVIPIDIH